MHPNRFITELVQGVGLRWGFAVNAAIKRAKLAILRERKKVEAQGLRLLLETEDLVYASAVDLTFARPVEQVGPGRLTFWQHRS